MLKIANWNIEQVVPSSARAARITEVMEQISPDLWILTETHKDFLLESYYSLTSIEDENHRTEVRWSGILGKYPLESLDSFVSDKTRCVAGKMQHPKYGTIIIYVLVLPWMGSRWRGIPSRDGAAFEAALSLYANDWKRLREAYPDALHIVGGDFNQSLVDWHYYGSHRNRTKLEITLEECGLTFQTAGLLDPVARNAEPYAAIDHICISDNTIPKSITTECFPDTKAPDKSLSDHFGIYIVFQP